MIAAKKTTPRLLAFLTSALVMLSLGAASASAKSVWELEGHHGPNTFSKGDIGEYSFTLSNVGDSAASGLVQIEIDLPDGVRTRPQPGFAEDRTWFTVAFGSFSGWDCGSPEPGQSTLTCQSTVNSVPPGARGLGRLIVYVAIDPDAEGSLTATATVTGGGADQISLSETAPLGEPVAKFGIEPGSFAADAYDEQGVPERQAGAHPLRATAAFDMNVHRTFPKLFGVGDGIPSLEPIDRLRTFEARLPRGFAGNPRAIPYCSQADFGLMLGGEANASACAPETQVGVAQISFMHLTYGPAAPTGYAVQPVYNLKPAQGYLAEFGLQVVGRTSASTPNSTRATTRWRRKCPTSTARAPCTCRS